MSARESLSHFSTIPITVLFVPLMHQHGIVVIDAFEDLSESQAAFVDRYFEDNVYPVLTPMAVDASRPFPLIRNKTLNIAALLSKKKEKQKKRGN